MCDYCLPTNDVIFHHLFGEEHNQDLLISLLTAVLAPPSPIARVALLPTEQAGRGVDDKIARLDVRVALADGRQVDVEMQNAKRPGRHRRTLYYWATMYTSGLRRGDRYDELRQCVVIWLLGYRDLPAERFHSIFRVQEIHDHSDFAPELELHTVELPKLPPQGSPGREGKLEAWARFLGAKSRDELRELAMSRDPELQKAWEEVERLNRDPATRQLAQARELALASYAIEMGAARQEGRAEGEARAVIEVLETRGISVTLEQRDRILACQDLELLRTWLRRAVTAPAADDGLAP
jgi:predicted transposase/invertase (TIGR01784 family)